MNTLWGWGRASWAGCGPDVRRGGQTLIMGYSADKSPLLGHLAGPLRRLEPLGAQRQEKCGPNRPTPTGYSCNNAIDGAGGRPAGPRVAAEEGGEMGDPAAGGALGPELPHVVVLEVGVAELAQGRPLGAEGARWRRRRASLVRGVME